MLVRPISISNSNNCSYSKNPSFKLRELYYGNPRETIISESVQEFKSKIKSYEQKQQIIDHILTKYFSWHAPDKISGPKDKKIRIGLTLVTLGMSEFMVAAKKDGDRNDANELACIIIDRILNAK